MGTHPLRVAMLEAAASIDRFLFVFGSDPATGRPRPVVDPRADAQRAATFRRASQIREGGSA